MMMPKFEINFTFMQRYPETSNNNNSIRKHGEPHWYFICSPQIAARSGNTRKSEVRIDTP